MKYISDLVFLVILMVYKYIWFRSVYGFDLEVYMVLI